ncbi:MAG: hypothetical protein U5K28_00135 [Halobacteriales archaeon]|nr:hypothetical protein [Halobacteriales archaeon]
MIRQAAKVIGLLVTILLLVVWVVLNNNLPGSVSFGMNIIVVLAALLAGLFSYVSIIKSR